MRRRAVKDKKPKHDASPGYVWILPRRGLAYEDSGEKFWNSVQCAIKVTESEADFLPFDLHPRGCQPQEATSFSMQETFYNRFIKCVEQIMMLHPRRMPPEQARNMVSYRARRFLPSVAGLLGLSDKEAASVGNWKGAGDSAGQRFSISSTMHVRYADTKLQTAARTKKWDWSRPSCVLGGGKLRHPLGQAQAEPSVVEVGTGAGQACWRRADRAPPQAHCHRCLWGFSSGAFGHEGPAN